MEDSSRKRRGLPHLSELEEAGIDPDEFTRAERDWYDASIRAMDHEIGRLTAAFHVMRERLRATICKLESTLDAERERARQDPLTGVLNPGANAAELH